MLLSRALHGDQARHRRQLRHVCSCSFCLTYCNLTRFHRWASTPRLRTIPRTWRWSRSSVLAHLIFVCFLVHDLLSVTFPRVHVMRLVRSNCSINAIGVPEIGSYSSEFTIDYRSNYTIVRGVYVQIGFFVGVVGCKINSFRNRRHER